MSKRKIEYVEGVQRKYKGDWVSVRGVALWGWDTYGLAIMDTKVVGVTENGYGIISPYEREDKLGGEVVVRIKKGYVWEELRLDDIHCRGYREYEPRYWLCGEVLPGVTFERNDNGCVHSEGVDYISGWDRIQVKSREGLNRLLECDWLYVQGAGLEGDGVYVDPSVSMKGVSVSYLVSVGVPTMYLTKGQIEELEFDCECESEIEGNRDWWGMISIIGGVMYIYQIDGSCMYKVLGRKQGELKVQKIRINW